MVDTNLKKYKFGDINYAFRELLGQGTYGEVVRAANSLNESEQVAIKIMKLDVETEGIPATALREIAILKHFNHDNIVRLKYLNLADKKIYLCLEYMQYDLKKFWDAKFGKDFQVNASYVQSVMYQIFKGVDYLHGKKVLHRDLKPQNILINSEGNVKVADFGLSRTYSIPIKPYTKEVLTLWYRAPELILGAEYYSTGIDMWSIGCIFGELLMKKPLFTGESEIGQLIKIFEILGNPTEDTLPGYKTFPYFKEELPYFENGSGLVKRIESNKDHCKLTNEALDLLQKLLHYNPTKRISCKEALKHPYFKGLNDKETKK